MNREKEKQEKRIRRAHRTRLRLVGTAQRPRLSVYRSLQHIAVQLIDDAAAKTIAAANDTEISGTKKERAMEVGRRIAKKATEQKITTVIFDRGPYRYHGRVKAVADGAREGGLKF